MPGVVAPAVVGAPPLPPPGAFVPAAAAGPPPARKRSALPLLGMLSALLVLALVAAIVLVVGGEDEASAGEIFLEPVSFTSNDPFTDSVDSHNAGSSATTTAVLPVRAPVTPVAQAPARTVPGATPGLYGGTRNEASCDPAQLISFLQGNPDKARAWGGVLGVAPADIPDYVRSLTPIVLQRDTRVTNHGFKNGRATSLQSVLQAGTAVMVDVYGIPRVKCGCGNPLTEPAPVSTTPNYTGTRWPSFSPATVINVSVDVEVSVFVLVDVSGGEPFTRPPGTTGDDDTEVLVDDLCSLYPDDESCIAVGPGEGEPTLGSGDVQVTLRWSSTADLDLAVTDPTGVTINYGARSSASGGTLDVDSNGGCSSATASPVENIYWPTGAAPDGAYTITVDYFNVCPGGEGPQAFELTFLVDGSPMTVTPASMDRRDDGSYEVRLAVVDGRAVLADAASAGRRVQVQSGTLSPGESATFGGGKGPGYQAPEPEPEPEAPAEPVAPEAPTPPDCSQFEEGTPMRILCEHDPFSADVSGEPGLPAPVPN